MKGGLTQQKKCKKKMAKMLLSFGDVVTPQCRKAGSSQRMLSEGHKAAPDQRHRLDKASVCLICSDLS